jgi:hypothetical protein
MASGVNPHVMFVLSFWKNMMNPMARGLAPRVGLAEACRPAYAARGETLQPRLHFLIASRRWQ